MSLKIVLEGKHNGKLQQISNFQPNWFAYAMWGIINAEMIF